MQASKEQERKALDQIKAIVATLGENSYIGTALTGCLEDAAENIKNDFAYELYRDNVSAPLSRKCLRLECERFCE